MFVKAFINLIIFSAFHVYIHVSNYNLITYINNIRISVYPTNGVARNDLFIYT